MGHPITHTCSVESMNYKATVAQLTEGPYTAYTEGTIKNGEAEGPGIGRENFPTGRSLDQAPPKEKNVNEMLLFGACS